MTTLAGSSALEVAGSVDDLSVTEEVPDVADDRVVAQQAGEALAPEVAVLVVVHGDDDQLGVADRGFQVAGGQPGIVQDRGATLGLEDLLELVREGVAAVVDVALEGEAEDQ